MKERLEQLREQVISLELRPEQRAALREKVIQHGETFLEQLPLLPVYRPSEDEGRGILDSPIAEKPALIEEVLGLLRDHVESSGVNLGTAGHLAFIPVSSLYTAALGDYLAAVTNRYAGLFFASPGAVRIERLLLRWMADFVGYPATAAGDLTSGGSIANLIGVVTAREAHALKAQDYSKAVVYLSDQTHHSVAKALRIAGLRECVQRHISLDGHYRMRPEALEETIKDDKRTGLIPWLIVPSAGTTDTGAMGPLMSMAEIAQQHHLWLHVDGCAGYTLHPRHPSPRVVVVPRAVRHNKQHQGGEFNQFASQPHVVEASSQHRKKKAKCRCLSTCRTARLRQATPATWATARATSTPTPSPATTWANSICPPRYWALTFIPLRRKATRRR